MKEENFQRGSIVLLDRVGYAFYKNSGSNYLTNCGYKVRLITSIDKIHEAIGPELEAVVALPKSYSRDYINHARSLYKINEVKADTIIAITERHLLAAANLRNEFDCPGLSVGQTLLFRDKVLMKDHLTSHGILTPQYSKYSYESALYLLSKHKKIVLKPRLGAGSQGVMIIEDKEELRYVENSIEFLIDEYEVEEFIPGKLYHIDSVVSNGKVIAATAGISIDPPSNFETSTPYYDVSLNNGELLDRLLDFNSKVVSCYPFFSGVTHHEVFVNDQGLYFCEIGARAGGGGVIACFNRRTGINLDEVVLSSQIDGSIPLEIDVADIMTGYVMIYGSEGKNAPCIKKYEMPWVIEHQINVSPGEILKKPKDWSDVVSIISVEGENHSQILSRLNEAFNFVNSQFIS
ncbi:ATP-grasp domain-containing protein [Pantoea sp. S61]|uniref:ATP-grasp domain-containing protein n=1 Tax=Pantoea sp. S61 TaxID=2767442 RepID=UPI00190AE9AD|nr:ATP-grasp domain-containing protein [Pantoea sp. S61]MBK0123588.1 ATP-grasp domain-containing protein [Pantoea sp. S61]